MKNLALLPLLLISFLSNGQWTYVSSSPAIANRIEAITEDLIIGVGTNYDVQRSEDGGATWEIIPTDFEYSLLVDIDFIDEEIGYICGGTWFGPYRCCLLKTIDAGQTWDTISANSQNSYMFNKLSFPTENLGFMTLESNGIVKTEDGGETFTQIEFDTPDIYYTINDLEFLDENTGFVTYT